MFLFATVRNIKYCLGLNAENGKESTAWILQWVSIAFLFFDFALITIIFSFKFSLPFVVCARNIKGCKDLRAKNSQEKSIQKWMNPETFNALNS